MCVHGRGVLLVTDGGAAGVTDACTLPGSGAPAGRGVLRPQGGVDGRRDCQRLPECKMCAMANPLCTIKKSEQSAGPGKHFL